MSKESLNDMIQRINEGLPSHKWINTSVGVVNMGNHNAAMIAGAKLAELKKKKATK